MSGKLVILLSLTLVVAWTCCGCVTDESKDASVKLRRQLPPYLAGTVSEYAVLADRPYLPVQGYGLVIGLGTDGASEVPAHVRDYLVEQLSRADIGSPQHGTGGVSPQRILRDRDTAVVMLAGAIPFGAPQGTRFNLNAVAMSNTSTRSLDGGYLMPTELRFAWQGLATAGRGAKVFAEATGPVFVNPYIDPANSSEAIKLREGLILGGGRVTRERPVRLQLIDPDFAMAQTLRNRINERFRDRAPVADAKSRAIIELTVPRRWRQDHRHFLETVMHLPVLTAGAGWERRAKEIADQMEMPVADHNGLSLVLEATGRQATPLLREHYASANPLAAFYAARAGLRLGDDLAGEVIIRFAGRPDSPVQIAAIEELGRHPRVYQAREILQGLLDDHNALVRVAAYEALVSRGDFSWIARTHVGQAFVLDVVRCRERPVIYATQDVSPRIVVFGENVSVCRPIYFTTPNELVTLNARQGDEKVTVYRKVPGTRALSDSFLIDFDARSLITTLGFRPEEDRNGKLKGLGLTYGQVVHVLQRMCESGHIQAKFILQRPPSLSRIYRGAGSVGRPNVSGE